MFCALAFFASPAEAGSAAGVYVGQIQGQRVELRLEPGGQASLLGQQGTWRAAQGGIVLSAEGESVMASLRGDTLTFAIEGTRFVLRKQGGNVGRPGVTQPGVARRWGKAFKPKRLLKGRRFKVQGVDASFVVPKGWRASYVDQENVSGISLTNNSVPGTIFFITAKLLSQAEASASAPQLLEAAAREELGDTPVRVVFGPTPVGIDGKEAALLVLEGSDGMRTIRARLGGIKVGRWGIIVVALHEAKLDTQLTPVFETVMATFKAKAPKPNRALAAKLAGCWNSSSYDSGSTGSSSNGTTYRFDRQGRYSYQYYMSVSIPSDMADGTGEGYGGGVSDSAKAAGSFVVYGNELMLMSEEGDDSSFTVSFARGRLFLNGSKFMRCQ